MQTPPVSSSSPRLDRADSPRPRGRTSKAAAKKPAASPKVAVSAPPPEAPPEPEVHKSRYENVKDYVDSTARATRDALAARAWAVYTLGGGIIEAITTHAGIRSRSAPEDAETSRLANAKAAEKLGDALRTYHQYEVEGLERIPKKGPVLVVAHHSLATYDIGLLSAAIRKAQGRAPQTLVDRLIFKIPMLGAFLGSIGCVEAAPAEAKRLLKDGNIVVVAPGGMREALRPSEERYTSSWQNRYGFARLALETQVPVVCAACPGADDLFDVYPSSITNFFLKRFHVPVPLLRGIGLTILPRAQKLVHYIGEPLEPPKAADGEEFAEQTHAFQEKVASQMEALLAHGKSDRKRPRST